MSLLALFQRKTASKKEINTLTHLHKLPILMRSE